MSKRMTIIFDDDELYRTLKVEAALRGRHAKDIVAEAIRDWFEAREDEELASGLETARDEWEREGGVEASEFFSDVNADAGSADAISR